MRGATEVFAEAAADLELAIQAIAEWGAPAAAGSRAQHAIAELRRLAEAGVLPTGQRERAISINALFLGMDLSDIRRFLPPHRVASVRKDLIQTIEAGSLAQDESDRAYLQIQTQLWAGAVMAQGGLDPIRIDIPPKLKQRAPDYAVTNGIAKYGVEIKRPMSRRAVPGKISDAVEQLAAQGLTGSIILDVTDCLRDKETAAQFESEALEIGLEAHQTVWRKDGKGFVPGFEGIMELTVVARGAEEITEEGVRLNIMNVSTSGAYAIVEGSLLWHHADWLRDGINKGLIAVGYTSEERAE